MAKRANYPGKLGSCLKEEVELKNIRQYCSFRSKRAKRRIVIKYGNY